MSVKAINWALSQRLKDNNMKIVLFVLADYADKDDATCWPSNKSIAELAELSPSTVKAKIGELVALGLVSKNVRVRKDGGQSSNEIQLHLAVHVDLGAVDIEESDATPGQTLAGGQGESDTPKSGHPPAEGSGPAPGQLLGHPIEPSDEPRIGTGPQTPASGGEVLEAKNSGQGEPEAFAAFWESYPDHELMDRDRTLKAFKSLSPVDQQHAGAVVRRYADLLAKKQRKPKNANTWLEQKRFANFPKEGWNPKPERTFVEEDSEEFRSLVVLAAIEGRPDPYAALDELTGMRGLYWPGEFPTDLKALGIFAPADDYEHWRIAHRETKQFYAWRTRIKEWTGRFVEEQKIALGGVIEQTMPDGTPFQVPKRAFGLRVPLEWPPRKDGSLGPPQSDAA